MNIAASDEAWTVSKVTILLRLENDHLNQRYQVLIPWLANTVP